MKAEEASATLDKENINIAGKTSGVGIASSNPRSATTEHQMKTMQKQIDFLSKEVNLKSHSSFLTQTPGWRPHWA